MHRRTSNLSARAGGKRDDSEQYSVLQHWASGISVADTHTTGQRASAHVLLLEVESKVTQGVAARLPLDNGRLDLLQEGGARWEDSSGGLTPSSDNRGSTGHGSGSGQSSSLDPGVPDEGRLQADLKGRGKRPI